jgi:RNA polymerase sigma-70 factor (ECF subfamily)
VEPLVRPQLAHSVEAPAVAPLEFEALVRRHQRLVFSIAFHFLQDRAEAEELAQDVFLQLHCHLPGLESAEHVEFWLRKVTAHRCIDYGRRRKRPLVSLSSAPEPAWETRARDVFLSRRVREVVATLSDKARMVVILRYQEELTPNEISDATGMPVATVKSHLQRSLATLRGQLARILGEPRT